MEFTKKNWIKMTTAVLFIIGAVFFTILLTQYKETFYGLTEMTGNKFADPKNAMSYLFGFIAALTFFLLGTVFIVMSMFEKTKAYGKWILCTMGVLCVAFMLVAIVQALGSESSRYAREVMAGDYNGAIQAGVCAQAGLPELAAVPVESWQAGTESLKAILDAQIEFAQSSAAHTYFSRIAALISQTILYGLLPLAYAAKKFFTKKQK